MGRVQVLAHASIVARLVTGHVIALAKVMVSESDFGLASVLMQNLNISLYTAE